MDEQQVNLTRFGLFFPEKRDFFLENSNLFTMGTGAAFTSTPVQTDLFFSRRIGLSDTGTPIPILGGARLAGKSGAHNIAMLDIQTDQAFGRPGDNFFVEPLQPRRLPALARRRALHQQGVGRRQRPLQPHDGRGRATSRCRATCRSTRSWPRPRRRACDGRDMAFYGRIAYRDPQWNLWLNYLTCRTTSTPRRASCSARGIRTTKAYFSPTPRPQRGNIKLMEPMYVLTYTTDQNNRLVGRLHHLMHGTTLRDDSFINVIYQRNLDVLDAPFRIRPNVTIPVGAYNMNEWIVHLQHQPRPAALLARDVRAERLLRRHAQADRPRPAASAPSSRLSGELQYNRNDVNMPWGDFLVESDHAARRLHVLAAHDDPQPDAVQLRDARGLEQHPLQLHPPSRQRPLRRLQRAAPDRAARRHLRAEGSAAGGEDELPAAAISARVAVKSSHEDAKTRNTSRRLFVLSCLRGCISTSHDEVTVVNAEHAGAFIGRRLSRAEPLFR